LAPAIPTDVGAADDLFRAEDLAEGERRGISAAELRRQVGLLRSPPPPGVLVRPAVPGDGIERIQDYDVESLVAAHARAAAEGRFTAFVPASGAATRMFKSLLAVREARLTRRAELDRAADAGDRDAKDAAAFLQGLPRFAFLEALDAAVSARGQSLAERRAGDARPILDALLDHDALAYAETPKGLLAFHRYPDEVRTAFDEHLVEASALAADREHRVRLHMTVSPEHRAAFQARLEEVRSRREAASSGKLDVSFSFQDASTDTIAVDLEGKPVRGGDGRLLFRPGGHGALLANLNALGGDILYVKNIDNVVHDRLRGAVVRWRRILGGRLVALQEKIHGVLRDLESERRQEHAVAAGAELLERELRIALPADLAKGNLAKRVDLVRERLARPIRVCAMVRSQGDPGGGPFWVREPDGRITAQIVETAQVDRGNDAQRAIHSAATHFNPADMVLAVRDHHGEPYDLRRFVDASAVFIAEKSSGGRAIRALEHPGLWNGGMAGWTTLFVEVPAEIFQPVKAINDLLGPAHQPAP